jgi:hypothetical protein
MISKKDGDRSNEKKDERYGSFLMSKLNRHESFQGVPLRRTRREHLHALGEVL